MSETTNPEIARKMAESIKRLVANGKMSKEEGKNYLRWLECNDEED